MKGRPGLWVRTTKLEARLPRYPRRHCAWNLDVLSDEDLEALMPLSEKQAAAEGGPPIWSSEDIALLERLWRKATAPSEVIP